MYPIAWHVNNDGYYLNIDRITSPKKKYTLENIDALYDESDIEFTIEHHFAYVGFYVPATGMFYQRNDFIDTYTLMTHSIVLLVKLFRIGNI